MEIFWQKEAGICLAKEKIHIVVSRKTQKDDKMQIFPLYFELIVFLKFDTF